MNKEAGIEVSVERELEKIFNGITHMVISLEKKKLKIEGDIPENKRNEFIEGVIHICKKMIGEGVSKEITEALRAYEN
ncbi:MAG: hypothetical protein KAT70_01410 [Thermoplasmata archaeon]|nr:hypothetical protein [Thermoplasmata archaeon]